MRTPLTAVIGYSETMLDESKLDTSGREKLESILFGARQVGSLIDDVLDLSKAEVGHLQVTQEKTEIAPLVLNTIRTLESTAQAKGLKLSLDTKLPLPRSILTDPVRLGQILINLIGNAIKFTDAGSVGLIVDYDAAKNAIRFRINDTGIGVAEEFRDKLFDRFTQADTSMTRTSGGAGLGLYISQELASLLNGVLTYIPLTTGSAFQLSIKLQSMPTEWVTREDSFYRRPLHTAQLHTQFDGKILITEDSSVNQLLIGLMLEKFGLEHDVASNGAEAVDKLREESFDLVLMDLQMPIMSGVAATKAIRTFNQAIPIVALSADVLRHDRESDEMKGFTDFLTKPIDLNQMCATFSRLLPASQSIG